VPSVIHAKEETRHIKAVYCHGKLCQQVDAKAITNEALLELDVDILIPAALGEADHGGQRGAHQGADDC
jgi:glutamate dehydrogenase (NADP+)